MIIEGNWMTYTAADPVPPALLNTEQRVNLCLRCGTRIWSSDMGLHDGWHARTGV